MARQSAETLSSDLANSSLFRAILRYQRSTETGHIVEIRSENKFDLKEFQPVNTSPKISDMLDTT